MKSLFIDRCETILVSMRARDCQSIRTQEVAKWLETQEANALNVLSKMCQLNILKKVGKASLTSYELSDQCNNSFIAAINEHNDVIKAASAVVKWYVNHKTNPTPQQESSGSIKQIDPRRKQAVEFLLELIKENEDLKAEVELLREENAKLHEFKNNVTKLTQVV